MAVDECLMESVRRGGAPTLRFYGWSPPCLSLGRNQPAPPPESVARLQKAGVDLVRRRTGGRAVLHDDELTYAVVAPARLLGGARATYQVVHEVLHAGLHGAGVPVVMAAAGPARAPIPSTSPCFAEPVAGELLADGRKIVGSAQVHRDGVLLQHGSILLRRSSRLEEVEAAVGVPVEGLATYVAESAPRAVTAPELAESIANAWRERIADLEEAPLSPPEMAKIAPLQEMFADPLWTWRR